NGSAGAGAPAHVRSVDDLGGRIQQLLGQGHALCLGSGAVDVQAELTALLRCNGARIFTLQHTHGQLAGLYTVLVVIDTQRSNGATLDAVGVGGDQRRLGVGTDLHQRLVGRYHVVVGVGVDHVDL